MKKRSARDIPDFSRKRPVAKDAPDPRDADKQAPRGNPAPTVKPRSTSAKSGRRGQ